MVSFDITNYRGGIFSLKIINSYFLTVNAEGLKKAVRLFFTSSASLSSMYFLSFTTPVNDIVYILKTIKCPKEITELFMLIYRFIFIVLNMAQSISIAQNCRLAQRTFKTRINSMALMLSSVFVLSYNKSLFMYNTRSRVRCYSGDINFLNIEYESNRKFVFSAVLIVFTVIFNKCFGEGILMDCIIKTQGLNYSYHNGQRALFDVNIAIKQGEKTAVIGSNGSGKSTLFLCLNGINKPQKGEVFFKGKKFDYSSKGLLNLRQSVGIVFQNPDDMIFSSSVRQDIAFGLLNMGFSNIQAEEKIKSISKFLNLESLLHKPVHELSGGEKKRVSLAGVMVMEPEVIILDEPGAYLDTLNAKTVYKIIDSLSQKGKTVIISSHNMDFV